MTTDRAKLEEAYRFLCADYGRHGGMWATIIEAIDAHLATLPKTKMVWKVEWTYDGSPGAYQYYGTPETAAEALVGMATHPSRSYSNLKLHQQEVPS